MVTIKRTINHNGVEVPVEITLNANEMFEAYKEVKRQDLLCDIKTQVESNDNLTRLIKDGKITDEDYAAMAQRLEHVLEYSEYGESYCEAYWDCINAVIEERFGPRHDDEDDDSDEGYHDYY